ncbi:hypothetical protein PCANC_22442 [Puccinia coronata f. sp. avenae]|uniref:Uncharacterized protein n=1 Tax=Puccinia coronata f. sp. avenae TaxID=200324 RepID=A0A2N5U449_9BASI|nr:hypothetical protein PCANC_22442 [Puccinia coronata f. sp. avenae]
MYTLARKLPNGQYLAPPQVSHCQQGTHSASPAGHDGLATPNAAGDLPLESKADSSSDNDLDPAGQHENPPTPGGATTQLSADLSFTLPPTVDLGLVNQSPARMVHQSPTCVDQEFSRLNFSSCQGGRGENSGPPTRKAPASSRGVSSIRLVSGPVATPSVLPSLFSSITTASRQFLPLTARGLSMTLDQFLTHAWFDLDNQVVRFLISMNQIHH